MSPRRAGGRGRLVVVGTGPGPGYLTPRAQELMRTCEVFVGGESALSAAPVWGEHVLLTGPLADTIATIGRPPGGGQRRLRAHVGRPRLLQHAGGVGAELPRRGGRRAGSVVGAAAGRPGRRALAGPAALLGARPRLWHSSPRSTAPSRCSAAATTRRRRWRPTCSRPGFAGKMAVGVEPGARRRDGDVLVRSAAPPPGSSGRRPWCSWHPRPGCRQQGWTMRVRRPGRARLAAAATGARAGCRESARPCPASPRRRSSAPRARRSRAGRCARYSPPSPGRREHRVIWDVGAGSGGFSVELALQNPQARVVAFEKDPAELPRGRTERGRLRRPRRSGARRGAGDLRRPGRRTGTRSGRRGRLRGPAWRSCWARPPCAWRRAAGWWSPRSHWPLPGWRRGCWPRRRGRDTARSSSLPPAREPPASCRA